MRNRANEPRVLHSRHHMEKDFDRWKKLKRAINASAESERVYFHDGNIWWVCLTCRGDAHFYRSPCQSHGGCNPRENARCPRILKAAEQ